ncbi:MAG: hypothetical protein IJN42_01645 [Clostridia bacterium]|nr:hypothetical protein [Clostridia bacterium]
MKRLILIIYLIALLGGAFCCLSACSTTAEDAERAYSSSPVKAANDRYNNAKEVWKAVYVKTSPVGPEKDEYYYYTLYMYADNTYEEYLSKNNEPEKKVESGTYEYYSDDKYFGDTEGGFMLQKRTGDRPSVHKYLNSEHTIAANGAIGGVEVRYKKIK